MPLRFRQRQAFERSPQTARIAACHLSLVSAFAFRLLFPYGLSDMSVFEALPDNVLHRASGALYVIYAESNTVAIAEIELRQIAVQVFLLAMLIDTLHAARVWYGTPHGPTDLFDDPQTAVRTADVDTIERYVRRRLSSVFEGAVLDPLRVYNKQGSPTASLFFAVSNPSKSAVRLATSIAGHILRQPMRPSRGQRSPGRYLPK
jgi:hypothetical protein